MARRKMLFHTSNFDTTFNNWARQILQQNQNPNLERVGIPEFLKGMGNGVEVHVAKLKSEIGDFQKLLVTCTLRLKKLGIPVKQRKLILKYTQKYRLGLLRS